MTGITLPNPMYGKYALASNKNKPGYRKINTIETIPGFPNNPPPMYAPKCETNNDPLSNIRVANTIQQNRFLGRNAYFLSDNKGDEISNQTSAANTARKIKVNKKINEIYQNRIPFNYDPLIYKNLNNTIGSDYTEKISSLDSFEYKYYRSNDPDQNTDLLIEDSELGNYHGKDSRYKYDIDKDKLINYSLLKKQKNQQKTGDKDKKKHNELVKIGDKYIDSKDIYKYCNLTKDEVFNGIGSIGLAMGKIFSLTGKGVLYLCSSITDNAEGLFEIDQNKNNTEIVKSNTQSNTKNETKIVKVHEPKHDKRTCKCNSNKKCNRYSHPHDLHIDYETASTDYEVYHNPYVNQNEGAYVNRNEGLYVNQNDGLYVNRNGPEIGIANRQKNQNFDIVNQDHFDDYKYENRYQDQQINYNKTNQIRINKHYDPRNFKSKYERDDYYDTRDGKNKYERDDCYDRRDGNQQPYNEMRPKNLKIDIGDEIDEYYNDASSQITFDPDYPQLSNYFVNNLKHHVNGRFNPEFNQQYYNQLYNNQQYYNPQYNNQQFNNQQFNLQPPNLNNSQQYNNQYNQQLYNGQQFNNQQYNNQLGNGNVVNQGEMQMYGNQFRPPKRVENAANLNDSVFHFKYNLNRAQFGNESQGQVRFSDSNGQGNLPANVKVANPITNPNIISPKFMDSKKGTYTPNEFDKYKTVDIVEKSRKNYLTETYPGIPNLTAYGTKGINEVSLQIAVNGQAVKNISSIRKNNDELRDKELGEQIKERLNNLKDTLNKDKSEEKITRNETREVMGIKSDMSKMLKNVDMELDVEKVKVNDSKKEIEMLDDDITRIEVLNDEDSKKKNKKKGFQFLKNMKIKKEDEKDTK